MQSLRAYKLPSQGIKSSVKSLKADKPTMLVGFEVAASDPKNWACSSHEASFDSGFRLPIELCSLVFDSSAQNSIPATGAPLIFEMKQAFH